ncbi:CoA pyrophosphatase [Psychromonas sp. MME1]|uniref:CoA pyrophosphatase n=1 Tax=Psychromonas sp. MME1 TaxID=3231032 RepID=UPI0034E1BEAB
MDKQPFLNRFILFKQQLDTDLHSSKKSIYKQQKGFKQAAVLIPFVNSATGINILFTERALHLRHHPGQISFPGGKHEASDNSLLDTALRETEEEIGILQGQVDIFGRLPSLSTISGFTINPYLGFIDSDYQLSIDKQEVRSVFEVPLSYLLDSKNFHKQHLVANKQRHYTFCIRYQNRLIWGATAQILHNLQQQIWQ